jgi:hypothetical protein
MALYPATKSARDRFVLERRGPRPVHDPWRHQGIPVEDEPTAEGGLARTATVFVTGRECPWRCVMCDLWQYTIPGDTPEGAVPAQLAGARAELADRDEPIAQLKIYNAGSFFDPRAVPLEDYDEIAARLAGLSRVIVESHPSLVGPRVDRLTDALARAAASGAAPPQLEVAMGLETAHPGALEHLHKHMTVDSFRRAADLLRQRGVALRVFLLVWPPFVPAADQDAWMLGSIDVAFASGASAVSLIPTRPGNGALEALAAEGLFEAPRLQHTERSTEAALAHTRGRGRLFVDLWDLDRLADCPACFTARRARLQTMNLEQRIPAPVACRACGAGLAP